MFFKISTPARLNDVAAQDHGFRTVVEEGTVSGGRVDKGLHGEDVNIACEISSTNTKEYEVKNIKKGFEAGMMLFLSCQKVIHIESLLKHWQGKNFPQPMQNRFFIFILTSFLNFCYAM